MKEKLLRNSNAYLVNILLFTVLFVIKPVGHSVLLWLLIGLLFASRFFSFDHTESNIMSLGRFKVVNLNSGIYLIVFGMLTFLYWSEYSIIERVYLLLFCVLQISSIKIQRST